MHPFPYFPLFFSHHRAISAISSSGIGWFSGRRIVPLLVGNDANRSAKAATASGPGYNPICFGDAANWIRLHPFQKVGILQEIFSFASGIAPWMVS